MVKVQVFTPASVDNLRSGKMTDPRTPGLTIEVKADGIKVWRYNAAGRTRHRDRAQDGSYPA